MPIPVRRGGEVRAPGMLESHYAPEARLVLVPPSEQAARVAALRARGLFVGVLSFAPGGPVGDATVVDLGGSEAEAARRLYAAIRDLDASGCDVILAWPPEERGLGLAIADRLRRAAAERLTRVATASDRRAPSPHGGCRRRPLRPARFAASTTPAGPCGETPASHRKEPWTDA